MDALRVVVKMDKRDFTSDAEAARLQMIAVGRSVSDLSTELATMRGAARAAGGATEAQTAQFKKMETQVKSLRAEFQRAAADYKVLSDIPAPTLSTASHSRPDSRTKVGSAGIPPAVEGVIDGIVEKMAGLGISRMGAMELQHVTRSLAGSLMAGMPAGRAIEMESPRLISALGPAVMGAVGGLAGLTAVLAPLIAAVGVATAAYGVYNANRASVVQRSTNERIGEDALTIDPVEDYGNDRLTYRDRQRRRDIAHRTKRIRGAIPDAPEEREADSVSELNQEIAAADEQIKATRHRRHGKFNRAINLIGLGTNDDDVADVQDQTRRLISRKNDAAERDQKVNRSAFEGDPGAASAKLELEYHEKIGALIRAQGAGKITDAVRQAAQLREQYKIEQGELARQQAYQKDELDMQGRINAIRRDGHDVESRSAQERVTKAQADLDAGPKQGPAFQAHQEALDNAKIDALESTRREKAAQAATAAENAITKAKQDGLHVEIAIARARQEEAQKALDNGPASGDEHDRLAAALNASKEQTAEATRATAEKEKQFDLETRIANLRGSSDQVHRATLDAERKDIERRLADPQTKEDEKPGLIADQAKNRQQQDEFDKQERLRNIDDDEKRDRAQHTGHGFDDQLALLNQELARNADRQRWNKDENGGDKHMAAQLDESAAHLNQAIRDLTAAEQQRITALQTQGTQIKNKGFAPTLEMKDKATDESFDRQRDAEKAGKNNAEALAEIEKNRQAEHESNAADESQMTPAEKLERTRRNDARARAVAGVKSRQDRHAEIEAANNTRGSFDAFFHPSGAAQPKRQPDPTQPKREVHVGATTAHASGLSMAGVESILTSHGKILGDIRDKVDFKGRK